MLNHQRLSGAIGLCAWLGACQATPAALSVASPVSGSPLASWVQSDATGSRLDVSVALQLTIPAHNFLDNGPNRWLVGYALDNDPAREIYIDAHGGATTLAMAVPVPDANPHTLSIRQVISYDYLFLALRSALTPLHSIPVRKGDGVILKIPVAINQPT